MKTNRILPAALLLLVLPVLAACSHGTPAESSSPAAVSEPAASSAPAQKEDGSKYPEEIREILENNQYCNAEQFDKISELIEQKKAECEEWKNTVTDAVRKLYSREHMKQFASRMDRDLEEFAAYYRDSVAFLEKQDEFYGTVYFWEFDTGNGQGTARLIHTYEAWCAFCTELTEIAECAYYDPES